MAPQFIVHWLPRVPRCVLQAVFGSPSIPADCSAGSTLDTSHSKRTPHEQTAPLGANRYSGSHYLVHRNDIADCRRAQWLERVRTMVLPEKPRNPRFYELSDDAMEVYQAAVSLYLNDPEFHARVIRIDRLIRKLDSDMIGHPGASVQLGIMIALYLSDQGKA
jgi:hypothetical protein